MPFRPDETFAFLREGYAFGRRRFDRRGSDAYQTRLLLRRTVLLRGEAAARLFYDGSRFRRAGAGVYPVVRTLLGRGGVQGLDNEAHRRRKALLMRPMTPGNLTRLADLFERHWREAVERSWSQSERVVLLDAAQAVLFDAVCEWAGVPGGDVGLRNDVVAMIDGAGSAGPRHLRARRGRDEGNVRAATLIARVRAGDVAVPAGSIVGMIARSPLGLHTAAVELLNIVRPTVAVAWYVVWLAHALHEHAVDRDRLADDAAYARSFAHKVRRFYPFFPVATAVVRRPFEWRGHRFAAGTRTLLDLYATCHDARLFPDPDAFLADRFLGRHPDPYALIPQGGGDYFAGHRCAGEQATLAVLTRAAGLLASMSYRVPPQDLGYALNRFPARPRSRFVMSDVRLA